MTEAGGLMSYSWSFASVGRNLALLIAKILKGAKAGELPYLQETRIELTLNLKAAEIIGLQVSPSLIARADTVIE